MAAKSPSWRAANKVIAERIIRDFQSPYVGKSNIDWLTREITNALNACSRCHDPVWPQELV
jgi:hypothetical protein